jgi:Co/Zn/Cd efflux system component
VPGLDLGLNFADLSVKCLEVIHEAQHQLPEQSGQFVGCVFDDLWHAFGEMRDAVWDDDSILAEQAADLIGLCRSCADEPLSCTMQRQYCLLVDVLEWNKALIGPGDRLADRLSIGDIVFIGFYVGYLESKEDIPEPDAFKSIVRMPDGEHEAVTRDHNLRSAYIHVMADAAVSVLAIIGLVLARPFGGKWMDPVASVIGALVIANWSYGLMQDIGAILLDMSTGWRMANNVRHAIEERGDKVVDLHVWRVGPGHMSAVISVATNESQRDSRFYHAVFERFNGLSYLTV